MKVIPALYHQLVLGDPTRGYLEHLDLTIRAAVRRWTRLPHDTPLPAFYADIRDGGLGLASVAVQVPSMKQRRLQKLQMSTDPVVKATVQLDVFKKELRKWSRPVEYRGLLASTTALRRQAFAHHLHASVDGKGLRHAALVPSAHDWVSSGTSLMKGAKFNAALGVRLNTLPTRLRAARGRPEASSGCDCCGPGVLGSLSHELQVCPRTHGARVKRHDRVLDQSRRIFSRLGYSVAVEPHIDTAAGLRKPDLVVYGPEKPTVVLDVGIVSDMYDDPNTPHMAKVEKYGKHQEVRDSVEQLTSSQPRFSSIIVSWRGVFAPASASDLRELGFTQADLGLLAAITVEQGAVIHRIWNQSTSRVGVPL